MTQQNEIMERALAMYKAGAAIKQITHELQVPQRALYQWLRQKGVMLRHAHHGYTKHERETILAAYRETELTAYQGAKWAKQKFGIPESTFRTWLKDWKQHRASELPFTPFKALIFPRMVNAPHLALMDQHLEAVHEFTTSGGQTGIGCLIVSMPPRHAKSLTVSRLLPAWHLGRAPDQRVILASYAAGLAYKHSRLIRNTMRSPIYQRWSDGVRPADMHEGSAAVGSWEVVRDTVLTGGGLDAVGVGGGITGKGGNLIIVDDPVKSRQEAESEHQRDRVWDWFLNDLWTRREPGAAVVVVMTRWHVDDLVGRLLREMPGVWTNLRLPALAEADDPLGREPGDALWEARFPRAALEEIRETIGAYAFAGLYQQNPVPVEGGFFDVEKLRVIASPSENDPVVARARFWDLAMSDRPNADYSAGVLMGRTLRNCLIILDVIRVQRRTTDLAVLVVETAWQDGEDVPVGIENAAGANFVLDEALDRLRKHTIHRVNVSGKKFTRAMPFAARVNESRVDVIDSPLVGALREEFRLFPTGTHDDMVDASAGAYGLLSSGAGLWVEREAVL